MKKLFLAAFTFVLATVPHGSATEEPVIDVAAIVNKQKFITKARPAEKANFYMYLSAAYTSRPCRTIMPKIVAEYEAIRKAGGELLVINFDRSVLAAKAFVKNLGVPMPTIHTTREDADELKLPGYTPPEKLPEVTLVDGFGHLVFRGHGAITLNWLKLAGEANLCNHENCNTPYIDATNLKKEDIVTKATVYEALEPATYLTDARPRKDAKFYVIITSASWCPTCRKATPTINDNYKKILKQGGEMVIICADNMKCEAVDYLENYEVKAPAYMAPEPIHVLALGIPGYAPSGELLEFFTLSPNGKRLGIGNRNNLGAWEQHLSNLNKEEE